jgi:hypothetical protein
MRSTWMVREKNYTIFSRARKISMAVGYVSCTQCHAQALPPIPHTYFRYRARIGTTITLVIAHCPSSP